MSNKDKEIIRKINELYIMARYQYLILGERGNYQTFNRYKNSNVYSLNDYTIQRHLDGKLTLGVFASSFYTKFICFDVDVVDEKLAKWTVYRIVASLIEVGVPENDIHISLSGNKGYHIEMHFNIPIKNEVAYEFYLMILNMSNLLNIDYGEVEYRPNAMKQGVKIPLGINFRNKRKKRCWFVSYDKGLKPIRNKNYILKIKQMSADVIYDILERERDVLDEREVIEVEETKGFIDNQYTPLKIYGENIQERETIEAIESLLQNGLTITGTRHNSLFKLAKYFRHQGHTVEECNSALIEWMGEQDTRCYTTKWGDCVKDIELITEYIYEKEVNLTVVKKDLYITYDETKEIMKLKSKNEKILAYCLLVHSKRYAIKNGNFYMTYKQMSESSGLTEKTTRNLINILEENGFLKIVERNRPDYDGNGKLKKEKKPNVYKIDIELKLKENKTQFKIVDEDSKYVDSFNSCILFYFDKKTIKEMLPRRQYESIVKIIS
ncbi:TOTE conflict system archaeo-eukaryotic primase domain-containing protein [Terribacillus sp. JSM ZJ617]|uniref:TOTE conflict system archaeo-eukaryotic primase domain-containing protein n=1 Tax=Terribacillus sp. JSM ZJ617 TaxID=3342119 RepID=UPI0035A93F72